MKQVFVSVGTHTQQFDRLVKKIDEIALEEKETIEFFGQTGNCLYQPKNFRFKKFLDDSEFEQKILESDLVIGHAGAGLIISCLAKKKKAIIMPRLKEFGEHTNSHQTDLANALASKKKVLAVFFENDLKLAIGLSDEFVPLLEKGTDKIIRGIEVFLLSKEQAV